MSEIEKKENLLVGVLANPDYEPSLLASIYIRKVLDRGKIKTVALTLNDIINGRLKCKTLFNVYYGEMGDGGIVSGILDKNNITFVGNDQYTCSVMLNKIASKIIFEAHGYLTPPFWYKPSAKTTSQTIITEMENLLQYPLLAKPVNGAASENIYLINDSDQLNDFILNNRALIDSGYYFFEQFIDGRELSAGYVNALDMDLPVVEIRLLGEKYQSNKVKFSPGLKKNIIPAEISPVIYRKAQAIARELNSIFYCQAFSRTDMVYNGQNDKLYILEINTNPGLLENSLLPLMVKTAGIDEQEFFQKMIKYSIEKRVRD